MEKLNFSECTLSKMEKIFKLIPTKQSQVLVNWITTDFELSDFDHENVRRLCELLQDNVDHWNEFDLSMHFVGPIFSAVNFTKPMVLIYLRNVVLRQTSITSN